MTEAEQNRLILDSMGLVATIAADFRNGRVEFEDLLASGREGLVKAARSFNPALGKFSAWAATGIRSELLHVTRSQPSEFYPKTSDEPTHLLDGDKIQRKFEHDLWGESGNARAICETWLNLSDTPEDLAERYSEIHDKQDKFAAAFISLTGAQRKLVKWVFLQTPAMSIPQAARELGVSRFQAGRMLKKALGIMREVIARMEAKKNSDGNIVNGRTRKSSLYGCAIGTNAA